MSYFERESWLKAMKYGRMSLEAEEGAKNDLAITIQSLVNFSSESDKEALEVASADDFEATLTETQIRALVGNAYRFQDAWQEEKSSFGKMTLTSKVGSQILLGFRNNGKFLPEEIEVMVKALNLISPKRLDNYLFLAQGDLIPSTDRPYTTINHSTPIWMVSRRLADARKLNYHPVHPERILQDWKHDKPEFSGLSIKNGYGRMSLPNSAFIEFVPNGQSSIEKNRDFLARTLNPVVEDRAASIFLQLENRIKLVTSIHWLRDRYSQEDFVAQLIKEFGYQW